MQEGEKFARGDSSRGTRSWTKRYVRGMKRAQVDDLLWVMLKSSRTPCAIPALKGTALEEMLS